MFPISIIRKLLIITLVLLGVSACTSLSGSTPVTLTPPSSPNEEAQPSLQESNIPYPPPTQHVYNPYPDPVVTARWVTFPPPPSSTPVLLQTYTDPQNQFSLEIPAHWEADADGWGYSGFDGYLRTGYLPEMAFMGSTTRVCERLANPPEGPINKASWFPYNEKTISACSIRPISDDSTESVRVIVKNPLATPGLRFFYIEADPEHIGTTADSLQLMNPANREQTFHLPPSGPMHPEDEAFWSETREMPIGVIITETAVISATEASPYNTGDLGIPMYGNLISCKDEATEANQILIPFGYALIPQTCSDPYPNQLIKDGKVLIEETDFIEVETSASGEDFLLVLDTTDEGRLLVQKGSTTPIKDFGNEEEQIWRLPIFYGETLIYPIWDPPSEQVRVKTRDEILFAFAADFGIGNLIQQFTAWGEHWVTEIHGFLVIDGEIQNEILGYDEIFGWELRAGKPFYFFRKGPNVGISYDGQILPVYYEDVPYGLCCGYAANNHQFGLRNGTWYYIQAQIDE